MLLVQVLSQVHCKVDGGGGGKVALVAFQIVLRGIVIVQDVAIELQRVKRFNYLQLYKRTFVLVEFVLYFGSFFFIMFFYRVFFFNWSPPKFSNYKIPC